MNRDYSLGDGVYYAMSDYAGFIRRLLVLLIDTAVLFVICIGVAYAAQEIWWNIYPERDLSGVTLLACLVAVWLYLTVLKRSRFRTIAYRVLGLKIVSTKGERPSLLAMTFRMSLWVIGPFNLVHDLLWLGADTEQQTLRDCYAETYVIRNHAKPIGKGPLHLTRYHGAGLNLAYPRVCRPFASETEP